MLHRRQLADDPEGRRSFLGVALGIMATATTQGATHADQTVDDVTNPNTEFVPKPFGSPLPIEADGQAIRTIFMYRGNSHNDKIDPARVVYYHGLDLSLVTSDKPVAGFPNWVRSVTRCDGETILEVQFRLSSEQLRQTCAAKLQAVLRDWIQREAVRLGLSTLKVEVQKVPAW